MKRSTFSAVFIASLMLSNETLCAGAESPKAPLTAAERAQCLVQVTEFNQSVRVYNAELAKLKALQAELDTLAAELDKEQAAVDRKDNAAMDSLNAKILMNNEMVERQEQMSASFKTMSAEHKERGAQFREACENRPAAAPAPAAALQKPAPDSACSSMAGAKDVERKIETAFAEMRAYEKQRQGEFERAVDARAKAQSWSADKRSKIGLQLLSSPKFMAFEREKQPYVQELMSILGSKPKNPQEECRIVQRIAATLPPIKAINARQYNFMVDEVKAAK